MYLLDKQKKLFERDIGESNAYIGTKAVEFKGQVGCREIRNGLSPEAIARTDTKMKASD